MVPGGFFLTQSETWSNHFLVVFEPNKGGDDGGGEGFTAELGTRRDNNNSNNKRRGWSQGKDTRKSGGKLIPLSHASNNKAFWETNKTSVEWSLVWEAPNSCERRRGEK